MAALPEIVSPTIAAIEAAVEVAEPRTDEAVIRASSIGDPCEARLWFKFRWAHPPEKFSGRMLRLFETGRVEEARMIGWLRMAGMTIAEVDPETGRQWEIAALDGHFRGHTDGEGTGVVEAPVTPHLIECKTHNAKSFAQLVKHKVAVAKPEHVAQMQVYMHGRRLTRALYIAKNKDTDELHVERVRYDAAAAMMLMAKAERIKAAHVRPPRYSDDPDYYLCRSCAAHAVCHEGAFARRNCRTCLHSSPMAGGKWRCERHERDLSFADQQSGCANHLFLPTLVPGEQIDAAAEHVTYRLRSGAEWCDGLPADAQKEPA